MIKEKVLKISIIVIALAIAISVYPILDMDEAWYASVSLRMAKTGNWLIPNFNGTPFPTKPPLWFWITGFTDIDNPVKKSFFRLYGYFHYIGSCYDSCINMYRKSRSRHKYRISRPHDGKT